MLLFLTIGLTTGEMFSIKDKWLLACTSVILASSTTFLSSLFVSAAIYSTSLSSWSGRSKFWFALLGDSNGSNGLQSMDVSCFFYFAFALVVICLSIMTIILIRACRRGRSTA